MSELRLQAGQVDFERLMRYGDFDLLVRLAHRGESDFDYPLLSEGTANHVSDSAFLNREVAHQAVRNQNPELSLPAENCRYIIAGQQAGLLTGPLYTVLKAITAISLSRVLSEKTGEVIHPLFWIASEDHDILEVNRCIIDGHRFVHDYDGELSRGRVPQVADVSLVGAREPLLEFLDQTLRDTEFKPLVIDLVRAADFSNFATLFRDVMRVLLERWKLRFVDPIALRALTGPVLATLVERWEAVEQALSHGADLLREKGYEPPLASVGFFEIVDGRRVPVRVEGTTVTLSTGTCSLGSAAERIRDQPQRYSTGAALRPVCQDAVLPVVATVGGPTELKYLWQILPIYDVIGVRPSQLSPRISATFLEPSVVRAIEKTGLNEDEIFDIPRLLENPTPQGDTPAIQAIERNSVLLLQELEKLPYDSAPRWLRSSKDSISSSVTRVIDRLRQDQAEREGLGRSRLERINEAVFPMAKLQERTANVLQFINLHGLRWIDATIESLDPFTLSHQVVTVSERS